jgi:hypothetical protein
MEDDANSPLDRLISYIETWLATNEANQRAVRPLSELLELYKWAKNTIASMPSDMKPRFDPGAFDENINQTYSWLTEKVPPISPVNESALTATAGSSTGITSNLLLGIAKTAKTENNLAWLSERYESLAGMQERQQYLQKTRELLCKLDSRIPAPPNLSEEFDLAIDKAFYYRGTELDRNVSAGIAMRNLHEHYKGKLFSAARTHEKQNMILESALARLSAHAAGSLPHSILMKQVETWSQLQKRLSDTAKNNSRMDLKQSAVELIAHIYTVLSLLSL